MVKFLKAARKAIARIADPSRIVVMDQMIFSSGGTPAKSYSAIGG